MSAYDWRQYAPGGLSRRSMLKGMAAIGGASVLGGLAMPRAARAQPVRGGTLTMGLAGANTTDVLDPGLAWDDFMMALSYGGLRNNLIELDADGNPVAELAESWESSPDAKTWIFRLRNGVDVARFRINIERGRPVLRHFEDSLGVRWRPGGAAIAAAGAVIHQGPEWHVAILIRVFAALVLSAALHPQHDGGMPADGALSGVCGIAFAFELQERA